MKITKIDVVLVSVLFALIVLEFIVKSNEFSHTQVVIGVVVGFSLGFKLSAVHGSTVSREAIKLASEKDAKLLSLDESSRRSERGFEVELERKDKMITMLNDNLRDRDEDVRELVSELESLRSRLGGSV